MRDTDIDTLLLIEIGGTHTRCALSIDGGTPDRVVLFDNIDHADLESVIDAYLGETLPTHPTRAALAVAAPVDREPLRLTNIGWSVTTGQLARRFGWKGVALVNDFEALACSIPLLSSTELVSVQPGTADPEAPMAVLGPGTGLGVSGLIPCGGQWFPLSGEGGHVTLAATNDRQEEVLRALRREHGHVSAERVVSGAGLLTLYRLTADNPAADDPLAVTRLLENGDAAAGEAFELFFRFLGTVAGDLALTLGARGGVYLGGGILPKVRRHFLGSGFLEQFRAKGRFAPYLTPIPVRLIVAETPALRGLVHHPRVRPLISSAGDA